MRIDHAEGAIDVAFPPSTLLESAMLACPACCGLMDSDDACNHCGRQFPLVAGIRDLRLRSDRYLSLADDRAKAERLADVAWGLDLQDLANAYYAITDDVDESRRNRFLAHIASAESRGRALAALLPRSGRVLEVGCGTGGLLVAASRLGVAIEGVDIASRWLVLAKKRIGSRGADVTVRAAEAERLPCPNESFRAIVADSLLEHLDDPVAALREWLRLTETGGRLVLWSPNRYSLMTDPHVGLWGLGFLPRSVQKRYVRFRRACDWPIRPMSAMEAARMVRLAGWKRVSVGPAPAPPSHSLHHLYNSLRTRPILKTMLQTFGPLWQIVAEKGGGR